MVSAKALCYEQLGKKYHPDLWRTAPLASVRKEDGPMAIQIFGSEPEYLARAAQLLESGSYGGCTSDTAPAAIDINMGCPVHKVAGNGEGSALMKDPPLAEAIVREVVRAIKLPVTVKIRAGWDSESINAPELAKRLEAAGAALVCVHARTRQQMYQPGADWSVIARVKQAVSIPVVGNGDVFTAADALRMKEQTGCDGVMVARGAMGNPWIFLEITALLEGRDCPPPTREEKWAVCMEQFDRMLVEKGERMGVAEMKQHLGHYIKGMEGAAAARAEIMNARSAQEMRARCRAVFLGEACGEEDRSDEARKADPSDGAARPD
jgi:nifR3 family TIM-barrel protein